MVLKHTRMVFEHFQKGKSSVRNSVGSGPTKKRSKSTYSFKSIRFRVTILKALKLLCIVITVGSPKYFSVAPTSCWNPKKILWQRPRDFFCNLLTQTGFSHRNSKNHSFKWNFFLLSYASFFLFFFVWNFLKINIFCCLEWSFFVSFIKQN